MGMRKHAASGYRGFTLAEVCVAMVIGAIGLMALSGIIAYVMKNNRMATDISIATALARQKIETIKLTEYNYVQSGTEYGLDNNGNAGTGGKYKRVTIVTQDVAAYNTKTVDVHVFFSPTVTDTIRKALVSTIIFP